MSEFRCSAGRRMTNKLLTGAFMRTRMGCGIAVCLLLSWATGAQAGDYSIYPGRGMGHIFLGMSTVTVHRILPPRSAVYRRSGGMIEELWDTPSTNNRLEIVYQKNRVVQIEATSHRFHTSDGSSRSDPLKVVRRRFGEFHITVYKYSSPHGTFTGYYFDAAPRGIAFAVGLRVPIDADVRFDSVIVHRAGGHVIPAAGGHRMQFPVLP